MGGTFDPPTQVTIKGDSAAGLPWLEHFRIHCHFATRPEVQGFRDQVFVVQIYLKQSLRVQSFVASKKALPTREEPDINSSIINSRAWLHLLHTCALPHNIAPITVVRSLHVASRGM